jgi:uncharacterized phage protein (TIGR02218 family)
MRLASLPAASNTAFYEKLQLPGQQLIEIIDLVTPNNSYHWTTFNHHITASWSGTPTEYTPLPGNVTRGVQEDSDLSVGILSFLLANTGDLLKRMLESDDISRATIFIDRIFADTPDLGRMHYYEGVVGNYSYNRSQIQAQARNKWGGLAQQFPYHTYKDTCSWRFGSAGCGFDTTGITISIPVDSIDVTSSTTLNVLLGSGTLQQSYSNGRFNHGRLTVTDGVNSGFERTIRIHTGDLLYLSHPLPVNSFALMAFDIFPGCNKRILEDCHSLYNNATNFLGWPWIPIQEDIF